jgi:hypothetical protein
VKHAWLAKHIAIGKHYYGTQIMKRSSASRTTPPLAPFRDAVIDLCEERGAFYQVNNVIIVANQVPEQVLAMPAPLIPHTVHLLLGGTIDLPPPPSALKQSSSKSTRSAMQLEFVVFIYTLGDKESGGASASKQSPEQAHKLMKLAGTVEGFQLCSHPFMEPNDHGFPSFPICDVLDAGQLKAYFGKSKAELQILLNNKN